MTKKEEIGVLYKQIKNKVEFREECVKKYNVAMNTLINNWFSRYKGYSVPRDLQDQVIKDLKLKISKQ